MYKLIDGPKSVLYLIYTVSMYKLGTTAMRGQGNLLNTFPILIQLFRHCEVDQRHTNKDGEVDKQHDNDEDGRVDKQHDNDEDGRVDKQHNNDEDGRVDKQHHNKNTGVDMQHHINGEVDKQYDNKDGGVMVDALKEVEIYNVVSTVIYSHILHKMESILYCRL